MLELLQFSLWLVVISGGFLIGNYYWGAPLLAGGVIFYLWKFIKFVRTPRRDNSPETPQISFRLEDHANPIGPFLSAPDLEKQVIDCKNKLSTLYSTCATLAVIVFIVGIVLSFICSPFYLLAVGVIGIIIFWAYRIQHKEYQGRFDELLELAEHIRNTFFVEHPRPPFQLERCARYYSNIFEVRALYHWNSILNFEFEVYPQDSFLLVCGRKHQDICTTVGEAIESTALRQRLSKPIDPNDLPEVPLLPLPPLTPALEKIRQSPFKNITLMLDILQYRPPFSIEKFCAYWHDREQAALALYLRDEAVFRLGMPAAPMYYPNDPPPTCFWILDEDAEPVEFIMALEEKFNIEISDKEAEKWDFIDIAELVTFVQQKIKK